MAEAEKQRVTVAAVGAWCVAILSLLAFPAQWASAKAGDLDRSFGDGGRAAAAADLGGSWRHAEVHVATNAAGSTLVASGRQLFRYLPNGRLDPNFGEGGTISLDEVEGLHFSIADVAIDGSGRIVVFGTAEDLTATTRIPNYSPGGTVHPTFAVVLRFDTSGRLDHSFGGGDGIVRTDFGLPHALEGEDHSHPALVRGVTGAVDSENRPTMIAATYEFIPGGVRAELGWANRLVARFTPEGNLDPSFGEGRGLTALSSSKNRGLAVRLGEEGLLVWGGYPSFTQVTRLRADGTVETGYGTAGTRTFGGNGGGGEAVLDRFGRLVILEEPSMGPARLLRLKADGSVDRHFGRAGLASVRLPGRHTGLSSLAVDPHGRVVLVGTTMRTRTATIGFEEPEELFVVGRIDTSGRLDQTFGHNGWVRTGFGPHSKIAGAHWVPTPDGLDIGGPRAVLDDRDHLVVAGAGHSPQLEPGGVLLAGYLLSR